MIPRYLQHHQTRSFVFIILTEVLSPHCDNTKVLHLELYLSKSMEVLSSKFKVSNVKVKS